ncbi:MAG TPA: hypothetical protein QF761_10460 [Pirellulales bacterium]|nr:hypothetical protein [Pirellulales bacterium]
MTATPTIGGLKPMLRKTLVLLFVAVTLALHGCTSDGLPTRAQSDWHTETFKTRNLTVRFNDSGAVELSRDGTRFTINPPVKCFWSEPVFSEDGSFMVLIANERSQFGGYTSSSIHRIALPSRDDPLKPRKTELISSRKDVRADGYTNVTVTRVYAISKDGKRLLVLAAYKDVGKNRAGWTFTGYRPFYLDFKTKTLAIVEP